MTEPEVHSEKNVFTLPIQPVSSRPQIDMLNREKEAWKDLEIFYRLLEEKFSITRSPEHQADLRRLIIYRYTNFSSHSEAIKCLTSQPVPEQVPNHIYDEWYQYGQGYQTANDDDTHCICSHDISDLFYIRNRRNGNILLLGSSCIENFDEFEKLKTNGREVFGKDKLVRCQCPDRENCSSCHHGYFPVKETVRIHNPNGKNVPVCLSCRGSNQYWYSCVICGNNRQRESWKKICKKCWKEGYHEDPKEEVQKEEPNPYMSVGKYQGLRYQEIYDSAPGYCEWVLREKELSDDLLHFQTWLKTNYPIYSDTIKYFAERAVCDFGKYRGTGYQEIYDKDSGYCKWILEQKNPGNNLLRFQTWLKNKN